MFPTPLKHLLFILLVPVTACSTNRTAVLPADFHFVMDVGASETGRADHVHMSIDSKGRGQFEVYDSGGVIHYDQNDILIFDKDQVLSAGKFNLSPDEQDRLWTAIQQNQFFDLTDDYRMAIGHSFAFIMIEAEGKKHIVDNIGMEVPEVRALVEAIDAIVPEELDLDYGKGFVP